MAKEKSILSAFMIILEKSRKEIKIYLIKSTVYKIKHKERLTKNLSTKVLNKLNAFIEISDYQVASYLMNLLLIVTSKIFKYCEKQSIINYYLYLNKNKILNIVSNEKELDFGYIKTFVPKRKEDTNHDIKQTILVTSFYFNRGDKLQGLSPYRYHAFI